VSEPVIKVCGLTRREDAALAAELGAWAVGFVLAPSPRRVTAEQARGLAASARMAARSRISGRPPLAVGVFVNATAGEIAVAVATAGLDAVQLHSPLPGAAAVRAALGDRAAEVLMIQAVPVSADGIVEAGLRATAMAAGAGADLLLLDTRSDRRFGGTGTPFPWGLAREAAQGSRFLVAGGLGPQNVAQALAVSGAFGADVSSGVETSPGVKDPDALRALFAALEEPLEGRGS